MEQRKLLLVSAHPDDDTMIGGTMATLATRGWSVHEFVCTSGKNGKPNEGEIGEEAMAKERAREINRFMEVIGGKEAFVYENGTAFLTLDERIVTELVKYLRALRPSIIVLLNDRDYHFEHRLSHEIGLRALEIAFRSANLELGDKLTDGVILKTDGLNLLANPLIHFEVTQAYAVAAQASREAYGERLGDLTRFTEGLQMLRGSRIGKPYAEAFDLVNPEWYKFTSTSAKILEEFVSAGS